MNYSRMDGFYGSMMAGESVLDAETILHGPGGCRAVPANLASKYAPRKFKSIEGDFFFHRARIPCTCVDAEDYIYGASKKVGMILDILSSDKLKFATILESPGASLIGDSLQDEVITSGLNEKAAIVKKCFMSETYAHGFDQTLLEISKKLAKPQAKKKGTVNLVGLPFTAKGCELLVKELKELLGMMDLEVIACIGMGCTVEQYIESSSAEFNVCICPEYFDATAEYYEAALSIPTIRGPLGAPVGYDALEAWIREISKKTGKDCDSVINHIETDKAWVERQMESSLIEVDNMNFRTYSILCEPSIALPMCKWLAKTSKMFPESIVLNEDDETYTQELKDFLAKIHCASALDTVFGENYTEIMLGPGSMIEYFKEEKKCRTCIDLSLPSKESVDLMPRSVIGLMGCRLVLDKVINAR